MKRKPILLFTDESCEINGRFQPGLPLLLDGHRKVVQPASDWFRYLAVFLNYPVTTLRLYAEILLLFWNYVSYRKTDWTTVNDNVLIEWRNYQEIQRGIKRRTINQRLSTILQFYWWAQGRGYIEDVVADPNRGEDAPTPGISIAIKPIRSRSGIHRSFTIRSPLLYKTTREPNVHTPTAEEATNLHATLAKLYGPTVAERNTLMLSWAEEAGLRRKEFASLTVDQIPDWDEIYELVQKDSCKDIELIVTKGGHRRVVEIVPDLLVRTRNYIEEDRADIVRRFKKKNGRGYKVPTAVFLSEKTGQAITLRAITNLLSGAFKGANVRGSGHRMRARYLTNLVQYYFEEALSKHGTSMSLDIVLLKVAEAAGHANPASLRAYLNLVRKRCLTTKESERRRYLEQRVLSVERNLASKCSQLETTTVVGNLAEAIRSGKKATIRRAWADLETAMSAIL